MQISILKMRKNKVIYKADTSNIFMKKRSACIAETEHGIDYGYILDSYLTNSEEEIKEVNAKIIRKSTDEDDNSLPDICALEEKAFNSCKEKTRDKNLDMKLVNVKSLFDKTKLIFYFVAENRVDFRELVRDLAAIFRTRIEMRQIGVRDESRITGGYGLCGRKLCCQCFKGEFAPVSIKMAKEQNLNLNSLKISGICGRLLCCLGYEYDVYYKLNQNLPEPGSEIIGGENKLTVVSIDTLKQKARIVYNNHIIEIGKDDLKWDGKNYSVTQEIIDRIDHGEEDDSNHFDFKYS